MRGRGPAHRDHHPGGPARHVGAAHVPQVTADQASAGPEADQARRAHPPPGRGLRVRQRQEAADLLRAVGLLGPLPGQRQVRGIQLRHDLAADEPQVRFHSPLRGRCRGVAITGSPRAAGGCGPLAAGVLWRVAGLAGVRWKVHSCAGVPPVVAGSPWTVRGRKLDWRWGPMPGNPRCCCVRVCQSPVLTRGSGGRRAVPIRWGVAAAGGGRA